MSRPTVLATIDRLSSYHAASRRRYAKKAERAHEPHLAAFYRETAEYHTGALDVLSQLRKIAPTRARTAYR